MPFDVAAAKKAGYSEDDILKHLSENRQFDIEGAIKSGYSKSDIIQHLASTPPRQESSFDRMKRVHDTAEQNLFGSSSKTSTAQFNKAQASATQDIKNYRGRAAGGVAAMVPAALLAPETAGASIPAAMGIMGLAGIGSGIVREGTKAAFGSNEIPRTPKDVAITLGIDGLTGMLSEGIGQGTGKIFKELIPQLVVRSAASDQLGRKLLTQDFDRTRQAISNVAGNVHVDVSNSYVKFLNEMDSLPKGTDPLVKLMTTETEPAAVVLAKVRESINTSQGTLARAQPLDALIEMRGRLNQRAYDVSNLTGREQAIMQRFTDNLDKDIRSGLKAAGGDAEALYDKANAIWKIQKRQEIGTKVVEEAMKRMVQRGIFSAAAGATAGGYGGYKKGGVVGGVAGAAGGAIVGGGIGAATAAPPKISAWVIERLMANPQAASEFKQAIDFYAKGEVSNAYLRTLHAISTAKIREDIKAAITHPELNTQQPQP